jgi:hypothetical protein
MNEPLKQFSEQLAADLKAKLSSSETAEFVKQTKASGDDRTFEVVFSTSDEDRQGDALDQSKWDLKYYDMNPVVLWAHNYSGFPIGIIDDINIQGNEAVATGKFAPQGVSPEADLACSLYQEKILRAVSPGYIQNDDGTRELLEVSFCPVPAGRYALSLRQVGRLGVSTQDLVTKGFFYEEKKDKSPQVGDACQLTDGTPGVLAEDDKNPGALVCVPERNKSQETSMKSELEKQFKAEHERHGKAVGKAIDEFTKGILPGEKKGASEGADNSETDKAIEEFKDALDTEHGTHLEKCMKAIDNTYETFGREPNEEKSIDEFKSAVNAEHLNHVKAFHKAIDEFTKDFGDADADGRKKAIDTFTKTSGDELSRHEEAHEKLLKDEMGEGEDEGKEKNFFAWRSKGAVADELAEDQEMQAKYTRLDRAFDIFYAFASAYLDEKTAVADFDKLLDEAVGLMKDLESKAKGILEAKLKSGRTISAKTKEKLESIVKALEDHHTEHGKSTDDVTAALKAIIASGDGGEETKPDEQPGAAPNTRSSTSGATAELETYLFVQRLVRQVKTASEGALRQINEKVKERRSARS